MEDLGSRIAILTKEVEERVISLRRHLHMYPEISYEEKETQKIILQELKSLDISARAIAGTGVIADIGGYKEGKCIAIRADIDALHLQDECGKEYQSRNEGICHGCGHDGHTAMLLGAAHVLKTIETEIPGKIRLIFQPGEEVPPGGSLHMIEAGALNGVDAIIGAHLWQPVPAGKIGITYGPMMAACDEFSITIQGRGGHGSMPEQTVDPILTAAQVIVALNTIVSRNVRALDSAVLSIGIMQAGAAFNVIPDQAYLAGTVRSFSDTVRDKVFQRLEEIVKGICLSANASYQIKPIQGPSALINNPSIAKVLFESGKAALGDGGVLEIEPVMGGEDFGFYLNKVPGAFMFIGIGNEKKGIVYPQHHPKFDMDEAVLAPGIQTLVTAALKLASVKGTFSQ